MVNALGGPRLTLVAAQDLVAHRSRWLAERGEIDPEPVITLDELRPRAAAIVGKLVAIEAEWRGDTDGWFVTLLAIVERPSRHHPRYDQVDLGPLREGNDLRLFSGQVPPWPEAVSPTDLGSRLAEELKVPLHFASPTTPDVDHSRWWDTD